MSEYTDGYGPGKMTRQIAINNGVFGDPVVDLNFYLESNNGTWPEECRAALQAAGEAMEASLQASFPLATIYSSPSCAVEGSKVLPDVV